jgi:histidyl-tRNA synthetase
MGVERVVELIRQAGATPAATPPQVYVIVAGSAAERAALPLAEQLRDLATGWRVQVNLGGGSFKTQFRRADKSGAALALILGEAELARGVVSLKPLRQETGQSECPISDAVTRIDGLLAAMKQE